MKVKDEGWKDKLTDLPPACKVRFVLQIRLISIF